MPTADLPKVRYSGFSDCVYMNPNLIDSHTHIQFSAFKDDGDVVVKKALDAGIWMICVGSQKDTSKSAVDTAGKYPEGVYATVGLHPTHTDRSFHDEDELGTASQSFTSKGEIFDYGYYKNLAKNPKVVAIGECGLDYAVFARERQQKRASDEAPLLRSEGGSSDKNIDLIKSKQKSAFVQQIELASEIKKPLMIHCRQAFPDLIAVLIASRSKLASIPGIIHFFSGTKFEATTLLDMGFYFTFGGVVTFSRDYDETIKQMPLSRILIETDAPYVAPEPYRGKRNEPFYVQEVAKKMAQIRGVDLEEISHHTVENARQVFGI